MIDGVCPLCRKPNTAGSPGAAAQASEDTPNAVGEPFAGDKQLERLQGDFLKHRAARGGFAEAVGLAVAAFGVSAYEISWRWLQGEKAIPGLVAIVLLSLAMGALVRARRQLVWSDTLSETARMDWSRRLNIASLLVALPVAAYVVDAVRRLLQVYW